MAAVWLKLQTFLARGRRITAHNAAFDRAVLQRSLAPHAITAPTLVFECTVSRARVLLPELPDHKLPTVCRALGISLTNHHDAVADPTAAGLVAWALDRR